MPMKITEEVLDQVVGLRGNWFQDWWINMIYLAQVSGAWECESKDITHAHRIHQQLKQVCLLFYNTFIVQDSTIETCNCNTQKLYSPSNHLPNHNVIHILIAVILKTNTNFYKVAQLILYSYIPIISVSDFHSELSFSTAAAVQFPKKRYTYNADFNRGIQ